MELEKLKLQRQLAETLPSLLVPVRCVNMECPLPGLEARGFINELARLGIWPLSISELGLGETLRKLGEFREVEESIVVRKYGGYIHGCVFHHEPRNFLQDVGRIRERTRASYAGHPIRRNITNLERILTNIQINGTKFLL